MIFEKAEIPNGHVQFLYISKAEDCDKNSFVI
jgi:hypothetical protein